METELARALVDPAQMFTFDRLTVGESIGSTRLAVDDDMLDAWRGLYGYRPGDGPLPFAFAPLLVMRAFLTIVTPRPAGNLHVGQTYRLHAMPPPRCPIVAEVTCASKEVRKERKIASFSIELADARGSELWVSGKSTMFWAA